MLKFRHHPVALTVAALVLFWPLAAQAQTQTGASQSTLSLPALTIAADATVGSNNTGSNNADNGSFSHREARFASGGGNLIYLAAGTLLPLLEDGPEGTQHSIRTADSLLTSTVITEGLKRLVREKRPDSDARTSFPSGHATAAFAVAAMQAHYHPQQALFWYGGATLIAASRVQLHRHYVQDVVAGAAVGYLTARFELSRSRGLILSPFIKSHAAGGGNGMSLSMNF